MATVLNSVRLSTSRPLSFGRRFSRPAILLCTDIISLSLAVLGAFWYWSIVNPTIPRQHSGMYLAVILSVATFAFHDLYPGIGLNAVQQMRRICRSISFAYLILAGSMVLTKDLWANSRGGFFLSWILALALAPMGRWLANALLGSRTWWGIPVIILGAGETASLVIRNLEQHRILGYRPVLCLDDDARKHGDCEGVPVVGSLSEAGLFAEKHQIRCAIVAMPSMPQARLTANLRQWAKVIPHILVVPDLFGIGSVWVEPHDLGGVLSLEVKYELLNSLNRIVKRTVDVLISCLGIVITAPIIALAALWIKAVSPGPAFYRQKREGRGGEPIYILKLRTMYLDADSVLQRILEESPLARAEWNQFCKLTDDPRILPRVGRFLRRSSIDELPQLFNILRGDMSLVGPRPFPAYHNNRFDDDFKNLRLQVTPGLTGLWQITARSDGNLAVQAAQDTYYVRNWSLWLDLYILIRTARVIINAKGAY
jgi:Undecaprenyl-phosphate galactose phosphotransferase WbaP